MSQNKHMTKAQLDECKALFGPAPVLSSEDVAHFETIFDRVVECLDPRNMVELMYIRHFVCASWLVDRYTRHGTVAIERRFAQYRELWRRLPAFANSKGKARSPTRRARWRRAHRISLNC